MDAKTKKILARLREERNKIDPERMTSRIAEVLANLQTAITGILEEELLEIKLKLIEKNQKLGKAEMW